MGAGRPPSPVAGGPCFPAPSCPGAWPASGLPQPFGSRCPLERGQDRSPGHRLPRPPPTTPRRCLACRDLERALPELSLSLALNPTQRDLGLRRCPLAPRLLGISWRPRPALLSVLTPRAGAHRPLRPSRVGGPPATPSGTHPVYRIPCHGWGSPHSPSGGHGDGAFVKEDKARGWQVWLSPDVGRPAACSVPGLSLPPARQRAPLRLWAICTGLPGPHVQLGANWVSCLFPCSQIRYMQVRLPAASPMAGPVLGDTVRLFLCSFRGITQHPHGAPRVTGLSPWPWGMCPARPLELRPRQSPAGPGTSWRRRMVRAHGVRTSCPGSQLLLPGPCSRAHTAQLRGPRAWLPLQSRHPPSSPCDRSLGQPAPPPRPRWRVPRGPACSPWALGRASL